MRYSRKISFCGLFFGSASLLSVQNDAFSQGLTLPPSPPSLNQNNALPASNQPKQPLNTAAPNQQSIDTNKPVFSFVDSRTGIIYDRYVEMENIPTYDVVVEQKTERRWVPETQTQNYQIAQTQYVPAVSYVVQPTSPSIFRPFAQPQYQYVQKVDYLPVNKVVSVPIAAQTYVEREVPVQVQRTVQITKSAYKYVDRARAGQPMVGAVPNYPTTPINPYAGYTNVLPNSAAPVASIPVSSPTIAPTTNYQYAAPYAGMTLPNTAAPPLVPLQNPNALAYGSTVAGPSPWNKFTNWISGNGPLFNTSAFSQNQLLPTNTYGANPNMAVVSSPSVGFGGPVAYAYQPTAPQTFAPVLPSTQPSVLPPQQLAGRMTIQPSTSSSTSRTAAQSGMPATEFR